MMSQLLISVTSVEEASIALQHAADIIDLKNPAEGALGALPLDTIVEITEFVSRSADGQKKITSATIGDLPMQPELLFNQVMALSSAGVDIIKIGFFVASDGKPSDYQSCLDALASQANTGFGLVAVLFAELVYPETLLPAICKAGFSGIMFDTVHKNGKTVLDYYSVNEMKNIAHDIRHAGLRFGLAGSLNVQHLPLIKTIAPDYIGFRGGVCDAHSRTAALDPDKIKAIRALL